MGILLRGGLVHNKFNGSDGSNKKYGHKFYNDAYIEHRKEARKEWWKQRLARIKIKVLKSLRLKMHGNGNLKRRMAEMIKGQGKFARQCFRLNARASIAGKGIMIKPLPITSVTHMHPKWKQALHLGDLAARQANAKAKRSRKSS